MSSEASIGPGTRIWHHAQVREGAVVGAECVLAKGVYVDRDVRIGDRVKVQNYASLYHGTTVEDGAFIGPYACLTNDRFPRAVTSDGKLKGDADWEVGEVRIGRGASVGAGAVILPGVEVGPWAMVGAGAVVTRSVPAHALVVGNPARLVGAVCRCGRTVEPGMPMSDAPQVTLECPACGGAFQVDALVVANLLEGKE
ncbi:MAG: N-acetyltransferase [Anaerolineae bacterium]|nr:N-acetyltransferase [Anaerolineae bacterium]